MLAHAARISKRGTDEAFACLPTLGCANSLGAVEVEYEVDRWYLVFLKRFREGGHSSNGVYIMPVFDHCIIGSNRCGGVARGKRRPRTLR